MVSKHPNVCIFFPSESCQTDISTTITSENGKIDEGSDVFKTVKKDQTMIHH